MQQTDGRPLLTRSKRLWTLEQTGARTTPRKPPTVAGASGQTARPTVYEQRRAKTHRLHPCISLSSAMKREHPHCSQVSHDAGKIECDNPWDAPDPELALCGPFVHIPSSGSFLSADPQASSTTSLPPRELSLSLFSCLSPPLSPPLSPRSSHRHCCLLLFLSLFPRSGYPSCFCLV